MLFTTFAREALDWYGRRQAIRRLQMLDDHLLADIGMTRDTIATRVRTTPFSRSP